MKPNWMSRELPMSWMSCICRKNAAPCSSLNAYPFPAFWGKKPRGFSEAKKPSFQLKNLGMSKKNHRLDVAISWTAELIWVEHQARQGGQYLHHLQWFQNAPMKNQLQRAASETAHPIPSTLLSLARFFESGGKGWMVDFVHFSIEPISSRSHSKLQELRHVLTSLQRSDASLYVTRRVLGVNGLRPVVGGWFWFLWWRMADITGFNLCFGEVLGSCCWTWIFGIDFG